ncbi:amidohydrolase [Corynebacterium freiburgense]|uniref:amidohydrolase n=1 Tax=Corynebacterium freiburgense TaxID=556548 RepID=UPI0004093488|nr:amidohydrolase [Corynebacterium freiburgense]WJZ03073.1 putative hydrolase YxeP [Corynebacterium freiburgense]
MSLTSIAAFINDHGVDLSWQREFYQWMHAHPELSGEETETAAAIRKKLAEFSCEVLSGIGGHGIVAIFRNGDGPCALMRADFDALPVHEDSGADFASTEPGKMHACGHDMHTTALLGLCAILDARRDQWQGTFVALFQPAEETASGAAAMVADSLCDLIPKPDVCFGQHVVAGPAGTVMSMAGPALAACDTITITIHGRSAHGSMPHQSIDPTFIAAMIVVRLQGIVGREVSPFDFAVVTVGSLISGHTNNTVPGSATLVLNCRFYSDEVKTKVYQAIHRVVTAECLASGCEKEPDFEYSNHGELTDNSPEVFAKVRPLFDAVFNKDSIDAQPWTASEDFSEIPRALGVPYLYWTVGVTPPGVDTPPVNHMPNFIPDYAPSVSATTRAGAAAILSYLSRD